MRPFKTKNAIQLKLGIEGTISFAFKTNKDGVVKTGFSDRKKELIIEER